MDRDEFLSKFGIGLATVCAGGCLAACGKKDSGGSSPTPPSNVNFTVNLSNEITAVGQSKISDGVIVVRLATGNAPTSFSAVQVSCTHEGTLVDYNVNQDKFICPNHGSTFTNAGVVTFGPATTNLKKFTVAIAGNIMTVTG